MRECVPVAMALCRSRASAVRVSCMCRMTVQNRFKKRKIFRLNSIYIPWISIPGSVDYYVKQNTNASKHTTF